ncbi:MAG: FxLYD domain-containing protein [Synergistaceae bacterium]|jgi:hypothetical protein|nr:FxLYD domain-containing protein [Synergistaceae bacterium]
MFKPVFSASPFRHLISNHHEEGPAAAGHDEPSRDEGRPGGRGGDVRFAVYGLFFGVGFLLGFLACLGCLSVRTSTEVQVRARAKTPAAAPGAAKSEAGGAVPKPSGRVAKENAASSAELARDIGLVLAEDGVGEDENGFFISGTVLNDSSHAFDAVRVTFDLCDKSGEPYAEVTDLLKGRMEPGDLWGVTIYIPYMNMDKFSSYRLQSIMGVTY